MTEANPTKPSAPVGGKPFQPKKPFKGKPNKFGASANKPAKFQGLCKELAGYIFECTGPNKADTYVKTKDAIKAYVEQNYDDAEDMVCIIDNYERAKIVMPKAPPKITIEDSDEEDSDDDSDSDEDYVDEEEKKKQKKKSAAPAKKKQDGAGDGAGNNQGSDDESSDGEDAVVRKLILQEMVKEYMRRKRNESKNSGKLYGLVWGQCTPATQTKLKSILGYRSMDRRKDPVKLLTAIRSICFDMDVDDKRDMADVLTDTIVQFYLFRQDKQMTDQIFYKKYLTMIDVIENTGGQVGKMPALEKQYMEIYGDAGYAEAMGREKYLAVLFLKKSDRSRYGKLLEQLRNQRLYGNDVYPSLVSDAFYMIQNFQCHRPKDSGPTESTGVAYNMTGEEEQPKEKKDKSHIKCFKCGEFGHYSTECPNDPKTKKKEAKSQDAASMLLNAVEEGRVKDGDEYGTILCIRGELVGSVSMFQQIGANGIVNTWVILDSGSTINVFCNGKLLRNIRKAPNGRRIRIHSDAGVTVTDLIGDLPGYGWVWFNPAGIANIISMSILEQTHRITYDTLNGSKYIVHRNDGTTREFVKNEYGLYVFDMKQLMGEDATVLVNTVADNKEKFSDRDYKRAVVARNVHNRIGRPGVREYVRIVENNLFPNCPVTRDDVITAEKIFGPNAIAIRGKQTKRKPRQSVTFARVNVPHSIMEKYKDVILSADVMKVNKIPFLVSISRHIKFGTAENIKNMKLPTLLASIKKVYVTYAKRGFKIKYIILDGQFEGLRGDLAEMKITVNIMAANEHVSEAERYIRTIKERVRCHYYNNMPYERYPAIMIVDMVYDAVFWLNSFAPAGGVSGTMGPREIITGSVIDYNAHCRIEFGQYAQVDEDHDNSMLPRTTGAIATRPTGNAQGGYYFFSLTSGRRINRDWWTEIPIPANVIERVHQLARRSKASRGILFTRVNGDPYDEADEDDNDEEYVPGNDTESEDESDHEDSDSDDDDDPIMPAGVNGNNQQHHQQNQNDEDDEIAGVDDVNDDPNEVNADTDSEDSDDEDYDNMPDLHDRYNSDSDSDDDDEDDDEEYLPDLHERDDSDSDDDDDEEEEDTADTHEEHENGRNNRDHDDDGDAGASTSRSNTSTTHRRSQKGRSDKADSNKSDNNSETFDEEMEKRYGPRKSGHNLRPRKPRDYRHLHLMTDDLVLTQLGVAAGIKKFGQAGVDAVLKEMKQLHDRKVGRPVSENEMTDEDRRKALKYLMFLKQKRCGKIKGRGCADGRPQRKYVQKEDSSSPTVSTEAVFITCMIDAKEGRDVATVDIPGAFMQADIDERTHVMLEGAMAELLVQLDPELYGPHLRHNKKGVAYLYMELDKALYGTVKAAMLFWKKFSGTLKNWGFKINPYDVCVANAIVDGAQCTIVWHVDDCKVSHVDPAVVTSVVAHLQEEYGELMEVTVTRGKIHEYLGMTLDYSEEGVCKVKMDDYIERILNELPEDLSHGEAATPAANHLFETNEEATKLDKTKSDIFHHNVASLLFLSKRARPDIQTAVAFMSTRVKGPDVDDYKKLNRCYQYLRGTKELHLTIGADDLSVIKWYVDASFAVHRDMKSHTGGAMTMGVGAGYSTSKKQRLNTRSTTESEVVGVDDVMPQIIWTRYFVEEQGYDVKDVIIYQDNQSSILLEKNGRGSSGKRTRHMNIRYFFIADRVASKEVSVQYCPSQEMVGDFYTKPLQGSLFKKLRNMIMGIKT